MSHLREIYVPRFPDAPRNGRQRLHDMTHILHAATDITAQAFERGLRMTSTQGLAASRKWPAA
eukprot:31264-Eustigmatos_ZCMA.PRE.1